MESALATIADLRAALTDICREDRLGAFGLSTDLATYSRVRKLVAGWPSRVPPRVLNALAACRYDSDEFEYLRALLAPTFEAGDDECVRLSEPPANDPSRLPSRLAAAVAEAMNDCSHMGPEFVALFEALVDAMDGRAVSTMLYTALRIRETGGSAPTKATLDAELDAMVTTNSASRGRRPL